MSRPSSRKNTTSRRSTDKDAFLSKLESYVGKRRFDLGNILPAFGQDYSRSSAVDVCDSLVLHRMTKGFEKPNDSQRKERKERTMQSIINHDAAYTGTTLFTGEYAELHKKARSVLWKMGVNVKPTYRFRAPSGESAISAHGYVDLEYKLNDWENWECSPENLEYSISIAYKNATLRRAVKDAFRCKANRQYNSSRGYLVALFKIRARVFARGPVQYLGSRMFAEMFRYVVGINATCRLTTVRKNNTDDRGICCAPYWDMICMLSYMMDMRDAFMSYTGIDIDHAQDKHGLVIALGDVITEDLKNASNSVWWDVVQQMFHPNMVRVFKRLRVPVVTYEIGGIERYYQFNMFAPMGNGLTFDVMTWLLWALCSTIDHSMPFVFGDDIIINRLAKDGTETAPRLRGLLQSCGLTSNVEKSFADGKFRESCGWFWHEDLRLPPNKRTADPLTQGYIVSYDFTWPETLNERFIVLNKIARIYWANQVSKELRKELRRLWFDLVRHVPRDTVVDNRDFAELPDSFVMRLRRGGASPYDVKKRKEIVECLRQHWQRKIKLAAIYRIESVDEDSGNTELNYRLSLRSGKKHSPSKRGNTRVTRLIVEAETMTPLRDILLASVVT